MAKFGRNSEKDIKIKEFKEKTNLRLENSTIEDLMSKFPNEDLFFTVAYELYKRNLDITENVFSKTMVEFSKIYDYIIDEKIYVSIIKAVSEYPDILETNILNKIIFAFSDKKIVQETLLFIFNMFRDNETNKVKIDNIGNLDTALSYLIAGRRWYVEDRSLLASFINYMNILGINTLKYGSKEEIEEVAAKFIAEDQRSNGIYNISHEELEFFRQLSEELGVKSEQLRTLLSLSDKNITQARTAVEELKTGATEHAKQQMKLLEGKAVEALNSFDQKYLELLNSEKDGLRGDRNALFAELERKLGAKQAELVSFINSTKTGYEKDLDRLRGEQKGVLTSIDNYIENSQALKTIIETTRNDQEFVDKLKLLEELAERQQVAPVVQTVTPIAQEGTPTTSSGIIVPTGNIVVAQPDLGIDKPIDYTQLYYFDKSTKYAKRFKQLMEVKKKLIQEGEIFHECFDEVVAIVIHNNVPYLYGPSGSGKTHMIEEQLSKVLGLNVITNGYIQFEQDVLGYNNAGNGGYVPSNFYRAYIYGDIIFFDELDNSNAKSVPVLNGFLTRKKDSIYTFPNGATIKRHPNFRIITAGNTKGEGRTTEYSTRQKMDESVLQRVWPVPCGFQSDIEKVILRDHKSWFEFSQSFRNAIEDIKLSNDSGVNSFGTFTTRDAADVVEYLEDEAFTYQQLIKYKFIQTKDDDYLASIYAKMAEDAPNYQQKDTKQLLKEFKRQMDEKTLGKSR